MRQAAIWWVLPPQLKIFADIPEDERHELYPEEINEIVEEFANRLDNKGRVRYGQEFNLPAIKWVEDVKDVVINAGQPIIESPGAEIDQNAKWVTHMASNCVGIVMPAKMAERVPTMFGFWTDEAMKPIAAPYLWVKPAAGRRTKKKVAVQEQDLIESAEEVEFEMAPIAEPVETPVPPKPRGAAKKKAAPKRKPVAKSRKKPVVKTKGRIKPKAKV